MYINTTGSNNTAIGYNTGLSVGGGTGSGNTILGANVTGLATTLSNNIILANGTGAIKAQHDGTNWILQGTVTAPTFIGALTGNATNVSGIVSVANGGTGATTNTAAFNALSPMTTAGDILYGGTSGAGTRLGKGADGTILTLVSGVPAWTATAQATRATPGSTYNDAVGFSFLGGDWARNTGMFNDSPDSGTSPLKFRVAGSGGSSSILEIAPGKVSVLPTTASTSKTTGALVVAGGVGINGAIFANDMTLTGPLSGGNTATSTLSGFAANMNAQTGTTYTLTAADNGKIITLNNAGAITLTVPTLFAGFNCMIVQLGAGQVTLTASSTTISNRSGLTKTAGTNAIVTLIGLSSTAFISAGDML